MKLVISEFASRFFPAAEQVLDDLFSRANPGPVKSPIKKDWHCFARHRACEARAVFTSPLPQFWGVALVNKAAQLRIVEKTYGRQWFQWRLADPAGALGRGGD